MCANACVKEAPVSKETNDRQKISISDDGNESVTIFLITLIADEVGRERQRPHGVKEQVLIRNDNMSLFFLSVYGFRGGSPGRR